MFRDASTDSKSTTVRSRVLGYWTVRETFTVREPPFEVPVTVIAYEPTGVPDVVLPVPPDDAPPPHEPIKSMPNKTVAAATHLRARRPAKTEASSNIARAAPGGRP
jgi:hypothetical protein